MYIAFIVVGLPHKTVGSPHNSSKNTGPYYSYTYNTK